MDDFETAKKIDDLAIRIINAIESTKPTQKGFKNGKRVVFYDLRKAIPEIRLAVAFVFPMQLRFGTAKQAPGSDYDYIIVVPHLFLVRLNQATVASQTLLHHELAHILAGDDNIVAQVVTGSIAYFNHPREINAFFQQGIAALIRELKEKSRARDKDLLRQYITNIDLFKELFLSPKALRMWYNNLFAENKQKVDVKLKYFQTRIRDIIDV